MSLRAVAAASVAPQPWRNGGGATRELFAWPGGADWQIRVSLADIDADGPFSAFPDVQRWFAVVEGAGVVLSWPGGDRRVDSAGEPLCFDGADAPACRLVDGPTRDLNLMLRGGRGGCLSRAHSGRDHADAWPWRACFVARAARWRGDTFAEPDQGPLAGGRKVNARHDLTLGLWRRDCEISRGFPRR